MINQDQREILGQFFGGCFHQDFDLDAPSTDLAVLKQIERFDAEELRELAEAVKIYSGQFRSDAELENRLYKDFDCYYVPSGAGLSAKGWVEGIANLLLRMAR